MAGRECDHCKQWVEEGEELSFTLFRSGTGDEVEAPVTDWLQEAPELF